MGNINLNSFVYNEQITKEDIFKAIPQQDIYAKYIGEEVMLSTKISSPLREDKIPSFAVFYHRNRSGTLMFRDFATKSTGDSVQFVRKMFGLGFRQALFKIAYDFGLSGVEITTERQEIVNAKKIIDREPVEIGIKVRPWKMHDSRFWKSFGIIKNTLIRFQVYPISHVFYNGNASIVDKYAYAYREFKDGEESWKIYQPFNKQYKWINNANYSVHQGYMQLPKIGDLLIITKALKDVMSLWDVMTIPSIGLQSESVMMKDSVMDEYKSRFDFVACLFDNDKAGRALSKEFSDRYNVPHFFMPEIQKVTDFSDLVHEISVIKARQQFIITFKEINNEIRKEQWGSG